MTAAVLAEALSLLTHARSPRLRTMCEFAEQEIVIPTGPRQGKFRTKRLPWTGLWLKAMETDAVRYGWHRFTITGPTQQGKSTIGFKLPIIYALFELRETVVVGVPDLNTVSDKWREDIQPIITSSGFASKLPAKGAGSRGGKVESEVRFVDGQTLRFMTGGGGDAARSAFTGRILVVTEVDNMDRSSETSKETDKIGQLEGRTLAYGSETHVSPLTFLEGTVTTKDGRVWREYTEGTASRIACPCPHCVAFVSPEREHLIGWKVVPTEVDARESGHFICPACSAPITRPERFAMNAAAVLVHRGQEIINGQIVGDPVRTETFGFRFSAFNALFQSPGDVAVHEWKATRDPDADNAERKMCQQIWCLPFKSALFRESRIDPKALGRRCGRLPRGIVPSDCQWLTAGVDLGRRVGHFVVTAWRSSGGGGIVDYGRFTIPSDTMAEERALYAGLCEFRKIALGGWAMERGGLRVPDRVFIDSGYQGSEESQTFPVYAFCRDSGAPFMPCKGIGSATYGGGREYKGPRVRTVSVVHIGEEYHVAKLDAHAIYLVDVNSDHWKTWWFRRLSCDAGDDLAVTLFAAPSYEHREIEKHFSAETRILRGNVFVWENAHHRANHWWDAGVLSAVAAHFCGVRVIEDQRVRPAQVQQAATPPRRGWTMPDGRPFLVTER